MNDLVLQLDYTGEKHFHLQKVQVLTQLVAEEVKYI